MSASSAARRLIKGGTLVDGTGAAPRIADVLVERGRIVAIGSLDVDDAEVLDATGAIVTPGFVDPHTHLDGQLFWDPSGVPSALHGVTTVVLSACGFGLAPCPPGGEAELIRILGAVEEIPDAALAAGVPFGWTSWHEYMAAIEQLPLGVNVAAFVPHSALRVAVLGARAHEPATGAEIPALAAALEEALAAGAVGFSTSRGGNHVGGDGRPVPSRAATDDELRALVTASADRTWQINLRSKQLQTAQICAELDDYFAWTRAAGARLTWTPLAVRKGSDQWREILEFHTDARTDGRVMPQVIPLPVTNSMYFAEHPARLGAYDGWSEVFARWRDLDPGERLGQLSSRAVRAQLRDVGWGSAGNLRVPNFDDWTIAVSPTHPDAVGTSVLELDPKAPIDALLDLIVADELGTVVTIAALNDDPQLAAESAADPRTLIGLGDSGAHIMSIACYVYPTHVLATLVRDRGLMGLADAVHRMTQRPAEFLGLHDRGTIAVGRPADVCVIDLDRLAVLPAEVRSDVPADARRLHRSATGYRAVLVNGVPTVVDDAIVPHARAGARLGPS